MSLCTAVKDLPATTLSPPGGTHMKTDGTLDSTLALTAFACYWAGTLGMNPVEVEIEITYLEY